MNARDIHTRLPVGEYADTHPHALPVLFAWQVDFAFNGRVSLGEACTKAGVAPDLLLAEAETSRRAAPPAVVWSRRGIHALIRHLVDEHHNSNREALPALIERTRRLITRDARSAEHLRERVLRALLALHEDLDLHLLKEERVLFPWILQAGDDLEMEPLRAMHGDHDDLQRLLLRLRVAVRSGRPDGVRTTDLTALYRDIARLDYDLQVHVHLENNVLFPMVAAARRAV